MYYQNYLENINEANSFIDLFHSKSYLFEIPKSVKSQNSDDRNYIFEKAILIISQLIEDECNLIENLDEYDYQLFESYIEQRLSTTESEYAKLIYNLASIFIDFKLKKFGNQLINKFDNWLNFLEYLVSIRDVEQDMLHILPQLISSYFGLVKTLDKQNFSTRKTKIIDMIFKLELNIADCSVLVNEEFLNYLSQDEKEQVIKYLFEELKKSYEPKLAESPYFISFFQNSLNYSDRSQLITLRDNIAQYIIVKINNYIKTSNLNSFEKLRYYQIILGFEKYHALSSTVKNNALLNIVLLAKNLKNDLSINIEEISIPIQPEHQIKMNDEIKVFEKYPTIDCLGYISHSFFNLANASYGKVDNEFHFSQIANSIMIDESGLPITITKSDEDRYFDKTRTLITFATQLYLNKFNAISSREDFKQTLLDIKLFESSEDKHIKNAMNDFLNEDYYGFVVRTIPLIEKKLRLILRALGEADITENKVGGYDYRPINSFMVSDVVASTFTEPVRFMFKIIFDDRRGFNLRNKVAHGIVEADEINYFQALMVLFTIIYLSLIELTPID